MRNQSSRRRSSILLRFTNPRLWAYCSCGCRLPLPPLHRAGTTRLRLVQLRLPLQLQLLLLLQLQLHPLPLLKRLTLAQATPMQLRVAAVPQLHVWEALPLAYQLRTSALQLGRWADGTHGPTGRRVCRSAFLPPSIIDLTRLSPPSTPSYIIAHLSSGQHTAVDYTAPPRTPHSPSRVGVRCTGRPVAFRPANGPPNVVDAGARI